MSAPDAFLSTIEDLLTPLAGISSRRMFGGIGLFRGGLMFGLIARDELYLKVGDSNRSAYEAAGEAPFSYETSKGSNTIQSYWRCPPDVLEDSDRLQSWARAAIAAARAAAAAKPKPRKAKASST